MEIQFRDLKRQYQNLKSEIDKAMAEVVSSACFISGAEVGTLEARLSAYTGAKHCITCANGTDAISIALMAHGIGELAGGSRTDAVFVPDFTFFSSGESPATVGATPIFVDVDSQSYNILPVSLERAIMQVLEEGELEPRAVVAVDLFGQPFDVDGIRSICERYHLLLLEDAAQGFGGSLGEPGSVRRACSLGEIATTSFFPAKPLGCYGDGGAVFTDNDEIALRCRSIAVHGKDTGNLGDPNAKYNNIRLGMNSRLDTLQAGILLAKLDAFVSFELERVNSVARLYTEQLRDIEGLRVPRIQEGYYSSWAQYTVQLPAGTDREKLRGILKAKGIPTNVYYQKPMHRQGAFRDTRSSMADCPNTERLCGSVLCLPIHPYLEDDEVVYVAGELKKAIKIL